MTTTPDAVPPEGPRALHFTLAGLRHREAPIAVPCQDSAGAVVIDGVIAACVADGVSTAPHSRSGSEAASGFLMEALASALSDTPGRMPPPGRLREAFLDAVGAWTRQTEALSQGGVVSTDFATTLTCVVACPGRLCILSVGDSFVVLERLRRATDLYLALSPSIGRPPGAPPNRTHTLVDVPPDRHMTMMRLVDPGISGFLLSTDGLEDVGVRYERAAGASRPEPWGPETGVMDRLLAGARLEETTGRDLADALERHPEVLRRKGDDVGVCIGVW